jgi:predicted RNase H-like HicB family nuclease
VIFEGDDERGHSAYSPDLPGVVAAGQTRDESEGLMRSAMADHILLLKEAGEVVPEPADAADVNLLDPAAA